MVSEDTSLFTQQRIAEIYVQYSKKYHNYTKAFEDFVNIVPKESNVLEIGVGNGNFTEKLIEHKYDVCGIDRSKKMLDHASERVRSVCVQSDLLDYIPNDTFDIIFSHSGGFTFKSGRFETYYQDPEKLKKALYKVFKLLKKNGLFLVNKHKQKNIIKFSKEITLKIDYKLLEDLQYHTYTLSDHGKNIILKDKRLSLSKKNLELFSYSYFTWDFCSSNNWIIGKRK